MSGTLWDDLRSQHQAVETALGETLAHFAADSPLPLRAAMEYSLLAPGKRLRPLLVVLTCEAVGGERQVALPGACAVEMVHTYSLIHDDLPAMDDDDLRRGRPTCHKQFGEALAILAGDALLTMAFEVLAIRCSHRLAAVSIAELARNAGCWGMVGGQVLDLAAEQRLPGNDTGAFTQAHLEEIHRRKTGALLQASMRLGAYAGDATSHQLALVDRYARAIGLVFQITDDLLDVVSTEENTGKRVGKDAGRGKLTYPGLLGVEASQRLARELTDQAIEAARELGSAAVPLVRLAQTIVHRDR